MGVNDAKDFLDPVSKSTSLTTIRNSHEKTVKPVAGIDVAIPMNRASNNNKGIDQAFAIPPMPASYVADYVWEYFSVFVSAEFTTVAVFDGRRYFPKRGTNQQRYGNKGEAKETLLAMYSDTSKAYTMNQIRAQQKKAMEIKQDVFYEVMTKLEKEGVRIICAPFEADSQLIALCRQGIIDYAVTDDSDIPFQGAEKTIRKVTKQGRCQLVLFDTFQKQLTDQFKTSKPFGDFDILAALLGNDYVDRLHGKGVKSTTTFMKKYCKERPNAKKIMLRDYLNKLEDEQKKAFWISLESWHHAPVFIVSSAKPEMKTAREAFLSPPSEDVCDVDNPPSNFRISLGPMSHCNAKGPTQIPRNFWKYNRNPDEFEVGKGRRGSPRLGFLPSDEFNDTSKFLEYFNLEVWCRTKKALEGLPAQMNTDGKETWPGAILDFLERPINTYPEWILVNWLTARDISCEGFERPELISTVTKGWNIQDPPLFILPKFILRGAGGYATYECLKPANEVADVNWLTGDDALLELRGLPRITEEYFTTIFGPRNGSRKRSFLHLTGGSFDLKNLRVTRDMVSAMDEENEPQRLTVIQATCTASQKLAKTYQVRMTFRMDEAFQGLRFQRLPLSRCECPVGCWVCAHQGALLLLIYLFQKEELEQWSFDKLKKFLPEPIHNLVNQPIPLAYPFPPVDIKTSEARKRRKIMKSLGVTIEDENDNLYDEEFGDEEDDEEEPELELDMIANPGCDEEIPDVTGRVSPVMRKVDVWTAVQMERELDTGRANKFSSKEIEEAANKAAESPFTDVNDFGTQLAFFKRLHTRRESRHLAPEQRNLMDLYLHINHPRIGTELTRLQDEQGAVIRSRPDLPDIRRSNKELPDSDP